MANTYLNKHLNGPYIQSIVDGIEGSFDATQELTNYLYELSIDTASEQECEWIGLWIGFPRPYIPDEIATGNAFTASAVSEQVESNFLPFTLPYQFLSNRVIDPIHGASYLLSKNPDIIAPTGGLATALIPHSTLLNLTIYKQILKSIAFIKWNGWNFASLDFLLYQDGIDYSYNLTGINYTYSWDNNNDIIVTFSKYIQPVYQYIFSSILNIFTILPIIILVGA